jgi:endonuclease/exonuclease/phosphatase family metal-dependent hydrolase
MAPKKKSKLRTASEVMSRVKWSGGDESILTTNNTIIGYDCRINGPMEKCLADFHSIDEGGDIPEHRIKYFRMESIPLEEGIFWDRIGRVDRLFGSGDIDAQLSSETLENAAAAIVNMKRLAEERAIRAEEKAKQRARRQRAKKANISKMLTNNACDNKYSRIERHTWEEVKYCHTHNSISSTWVMRSTEEACKCMSSESNHFKFITWNVLFDMTRDENGYFVQGDDSLLSDTDTTDIRWNNILHTLEAEAASVIALQEVTPRFIDQLQAQNWVKQDYVLSSGHNDLSCLNPYGNLIMWRKGLFQPCGLYVCKDLNRCRAMVVTLKFDKDRAFNVANVHLPADKHNEVSRDTTDRTAARQKEMGAIIAKLQILEQTQKRLHTTPIIMGDFNTDIEIVPNDHFDDAWLISSENHPGLTYDWKANQRAEKLRSKGFSRKEPRRIDRIYIGQNCFDDVVEAKLIGNSETKYNFPPSDHFGVSVTLTDKGKRSTSPILYNPNKIGHNAWSKTANPTTESLLALVFNSSDCNGTTLCDKSSSLPITHITLLNGFVDMSSYEKQKLATQAVKDAVQQMLHSNKSTNQQSTHQKWLLSLDKNCFKIFEHRNSVTLVCCPDVKSGCGQWLTWLYETLRSKFSLCHEQESRFASGWTPHFSLGSFTDVSEAREKMCRLQSEASWQHNVSNIHAYGVALFQRDPSNGNFHLVTSVPLVEEKFTILYDMGASVSDSMNGLSSLVLDEIYRACQYVTMDLGLNVELNLQTYGSHFVGISLPGISDIDAIIKLKSLYQSDDSILKSQSNENLLQMVASRLSLHKDAKIRIRVSNAGDRAFRILTVKLANQYPSLDLLVCKIDSNNEPIDNISVDAIEVVKDSMVLISSMNSFQPLTTLNVVEIICGAMRVIKLWANQRQIYGTQFGFLGGGGWNILLLWLLHKSSKEEIMTLFDSDKVSSVSRRIVLHFFQNILSNWTTQDVITLTGYDTNSAQLIEQATELVLSRGSMAVIAPISGGNFGRSSTKSTTLTTQAEILRVQQLLQRKDDLDDSLFETFIMDCGLLLVMEVEIKPQNCTDSPPRPSEVKAWGIARTLSLIVALEHVINPNIVRPISNIVRKGGSFIFYIGIRDSSEITKSLLNDFIIKQTILVENEAKAFIGNARVSLTHQSIEDFED